MHRLRYAALALAGLLALSFALAFVLIDGETVRDAIGARLEATLGEPVELGAAELSVFPLPAARIRDARIGARLEVREIRAVVSLPALLIGRVVLRSLELESPKLRLSAPAELPAVSGSPSRWSAKRAEDVELAITSLTVHDGTLEVDGQQFEQVELSGGLDLSLGASFDFSAQAPGLARFEEGRLEVDGLSGDPSQWSWKASSAVAGIDLESLRERLDFRGLWGKAKGTLSAAGTGTSAQSAHLELESEDLEVRGDLLRLWGTTRLSAEYPARTLDIDLTQAQVSIAQQLLEKPTGVALGVSAREIELEERTLRVGELRIESDALRAGGQLELQPGAPSLELDSGAIDLARLASAWSGPSWLPRTGRLDLETLRFAGDTLALRADGSVSQVVVPFPGGRDVEVAGSVFVDGTTVGCDGLSAEIAGETLSVSARYDWVSKQAQLALLTEGARVRPALEKIAGFTEVSGRLYARLELAGPLDWYSMKGKGEFELVDGEWKGLKLAQAAIREPVFEQVPRPDPPQRIRGRIEVDEDEVNLVEGYVEQDDAQAKLMGVLYLRDLTVDLSGELTLLTPEVGGPAVLPILKVGGDLNAMSMSVGNGETQEVREAEINMTEAFRKAEREQRKAEREKRKSGGSGS
jgi:uncharacterized protein involved in outer membrane biogenesis